MAECLNIWDFAFQSLIQICFQEDKLYTKQIVSVVDR